MLWETSKECKRYHILKKKKKVLANLMHGRIMVIWGVLDESHVCGEAMLF